MDCFQNTSMSQVFTMAHSMPSNYLEHGGTAIGVFLLPLPSSFSCGRLWNLVGSAEVIEMSTLQIGSSP